MYEQAIQVAMSEFLRIMIDLNCDYSKWGVQEQWEKQREEIERLGFANKTISKLQLSGA